MELRILAPHLRRQSDRPARITLRTAYVTRRRVCNLGRATPSPSMHLQPTTTAPHTPTTIQAPTGTLLAFPSLAMLVHACLHLTAISPHLWTPSRAPNTSELTGQVTTVPACTARASFPVPTQALPPSMHVAATCKRRQAPCLLHSHPQQSQRQCARILFLYHSHLLPSHKDLL